MFVGLWRRRYLVSVQADLNGVDKYGYTLLNVATIKKVSQCVDWLIRRGFECSYQGKYHCSIHHSSQNSNILKCFQPKTRSFDHPVPPWICSWKSRGAIGLIFIRSYWSIRSKEKLLSAYSKLYQKNNQLKVKLAKLLTLDNKSDVYDNKWKSFVVLLNQDFVLFR